MITSDVFAAELTDSLSLLRELISREALTRPEAEAWIRVELFAMTSLNYLERNAGVVDLVAQNIACRMAAYLPHPDPKTLT